MAAAHTPALLLLGTLNDHTSSTLHTVADHPARSRVRTGQTPPPPMPPRVPAMVFELPLPHAPAMIQPPNARPPQKLEGYKPARKSRRGALRKAPRVRRPGGGTDVVACSREQIPKAKPFSKVDIFGADKPRCVYKSPGETQSGHARLARAEPSAHARALPSTQRITIRRHRCWIGIESRQASVGLRGKPPGSPSCSAVARPVERELSKPWRRTRIQDVPLLWKVGK